MWALSTVEGARSGTGSLMARPGLQRAVPAGLQGHAAAGRKTVHTPATVVLALKLRLTCPRMADVASGRGLFYLHTDSKSKSEKKMGNVSFWRVPGPHWRKLEEIWIRSGYG